MKKSVILILILLIVPIISAVEFDMKSNFSQGETLIAKISGNFLEPILKENIFFYRDRHVRVPIKSFDVGKINDEFYIYALLSDKEPYNNYSLIIKNVKYMKGSQISEEEIVKDFAINEDISDFSINPGFVITKEDFFIEVQNLQDYKITIQVKTITENETSDEDAITLISGEIKKISFNIEDAEQPTFKMIELSTENFTYSIPVYIYLESESQKKEKDFDFDPPELNISLPTNSNTTRIIYLYNTGEEILENISLSVSNSLKPYINISAINIEELEKNSTIKIELYIFSKEEGEVKGYIKAQIENESLFTYSEISLNFLKDYVPSEDEIPITKTCLELNGEKCDSGEECNMETINAKDGVCCLGTCEEIKESNLGLIIGIGMLIIVAGIIAWFFIKKYRGAKKPVDLLKIAKGKRQEPQMIHQTRKIEQPIIRRNISQPVKFVNRPVQQRPKTIIRYVETPVIKEVEKIVEKPIIKEVEKIVEKPVIKNVEKKIFVERPKRPAPPRFKYKASTESQTYHKTSCRLAKLIKQKYKLTSNNINYFKKKGYKPCKVCLGKS
jgi:hypothetical protein